VAAPHPGDMAHPQLELCPQFGTPVVPVQVPKRESSLGGPCGGASGAPRMVDMGRSRSGFPLADASEALRCDTQTVIFRWPLARPH
jgi:hypothetical protein